MHLEPPKGYDPNATTHRALSNDEILAQVKTPDNLRWYVEQITEQRKRDTYVCPLCGSGNGPKKTAAFHLKDDRWKCFSCDEGGDVLDLIGKVEGIDEYTDRLHRAAELFGAETDVPRGQPAPAPVVPAMPERPKPDYSKGRAGEQAYIEAMRANIAQAADYLQSRGWTVAEAMDYGLGYDPSKKRLILPWAGTAYYHIDRDITGTHGHKYEKPKSDTVGEQPVFNPQAMDGQAFIVVEGVMDALAVMRCGIEAVVALGGIGYNQLLTELKGRHYQGCVVLMLDNDDSGKDAQRKFAQKLDEAGIAHRDVTYGDGIAYKDVDELYGIDNGETARTFLQNLMTEAVQAAEAADRHPNMTLHDPARVVEAIFFEEDADEPIPTGFAPLDNAIGGGLMRGLYILGATSSFGKTTISVQASDHMAAQGHPVLFVTIEQSAQEIVAKSLSRLTHDRRNSVAGGISAQEITTLTARRTWGEPKWKALTTANNVYVGTIAPKLRILEGVTRPSVADVRAAAEAMTAEFGMAPVIVIDYLQLLAPFDRHDSDKQAIDYNITALRQFARDLKTPIWCVATLNRSSYSGPVDLDSFKESGSIEYGADCLFGLQPQGIAQEVEQVKSAVEKQLRGNAFVARAKRPENNPRKVELTILKNRQGETTGTSRGIPMLYYPRTNLFEC